MHESPDRVKDASPERQYGFSCCHRVRAILSRVLDDVPLLGVRRTSAVIGAPFMLEEPTRGSGPTEIRVPTRRREAPHLPEDRDAFHRIEREGTGVLRKDVLPPAFAPALPLTPPTPGLPLWEGCF